MASIIICKKPDGRILVNAVPDEAAGAYEQDAVQAASVDEAAKMAADALRDEQTHTGAAGEEDLPADGDAAPEGAEGMPMESRDDQMAAGFTRAKKGY
jgi:hypothetical protein